MSEEELRKRLQKVMAGPGTIQEKLALFQALEAERRASLILHKLNALESNLIAELRLFRLRSEEPSGQVREPVKKRRWLWKKKKRGE